MSMMTRFSAPSLYQLAAPPARLVRPDTTAASRSAFGRSLIADIAMSRPSDDTAMASITPAVPEVNESSSQLKVFASALRLLLVSVEYGEVIAVVPLVAAEFR